MALKALFTATVLLLSVVVTTALLSRLPLPGATPDAVLVAVIAIGLAGGVRWGLVAGFAGGLLLDLAPPAVTPIGTHALILCVLGAVSGRWSQRSQRGVGTTLLLVAGSAVAAQVLRAAMGLMVRDGRVDAVTTPLFALTGAAYAVILAPFLIPLVVFAFARLRSPGSGARHGSRR
jgi:rod shape-determining protein MreD